jgi:predicted transposase YdaD
MTRAPFDGRFKLLAEDHPELLLRLLGIVDPGTRELQLDPMAVDHVYRIGDEVSGRLVHFEAITKWLRSQTSRLALYPLLLKHKFKLPVESFAVLMAEKYAPKRMPARVSYEEPDGFRIEAPYQVIRLWEIDPAIAFEPGCEALLPWVPLLKGGIAEFERAALGIERLAECPERAPYSMAVMVNNIATLATLRYDKDVIRQLLEHLRREGMLPTEALKVSWLYKDGVKAGRQRGLKKGLERGLERGRLAAKRESLRLAIEKRFPAIGPLPQIDVIAPPEVLDQLLLAILEATSPDEVRRAVASAVGTD